jgi:hypothetical protein
MGVPLFMMEGQVRPVLGIALAVFGLYLLVNRARNGWKLPPAEPVIEVGDL